MVSRVVHIPDSIRIHRRGPVALKEGWVTSYEHCTTIEEVLELTPMPQIFDELDETEEGLTINYRFPLLSDALLYELTERCYEIGRTRKYLWDAEGTSVVVVWFRSYAID